MWRLSLLVTMTDLRRVRADTFWIPEVEPIKMVLVVFPTWRRVGGWLVVGWDRGGGNSGGGTKHGLVHRCPDVSLVGVFVASGTCGRGGRSWFVRGGGSGGGWEWVIGSGGWGDVGCPPVGGGGGDTVDPVGCTSGVGVTDGGGGDTADLDCVRCLGAVDDDGGGGDAVDLDCFRDFVVTVGRGCPFCVGDCGKGGGGDVVDGGGGRGGGTSTEILFEPSSFICSVPFFLLWKSLDFFKLLTGWTFSPFLI